MSFERIELLLKGESPSLKDYTLLIQVTDQAPTDLLWNLLISFPESHWLVKLVISKALQERLPKEKTEQAVNSIIKRLQERVGKPLTISSSGAQKTVTVEEYVRRQWR